MTNTVSKFEASSHFSQLPQADIPRSSFKRSCGWKGQLNDGDLTPIFVDEVLPGDTFALNSTLLVRMATPIAPFMDNLKVDTHYFFVPCRLLWEHWEAFMGARKNPSDSIDYVIPQTTAPSSGGFPIGSLEDAFGIPTGVGGLKVNELFARAYDKIWDDWYRDGNLQDCVFTDESDTGKNGYHVIRKRAKYHDYFTSCLPWPQRGPSVELPLGSAADVYLKDVSPISYVSKVSGSTSAYVVADSSSTSNVPILRKKDSGVTALYADLSYASAITINDLRQAFQVQKLYERDARGGSARYTEILHSHFGVVSPDARLQRAEYLGGGTQSINVNTVAQTSSSDAVSPQGNLSAFAMALGNRNGFTKSFTEHGIIIGLASIRADLTYQQGLNRMFSRSGRFDYYWPEFSHLGEQAVLNKEIYAQNNANDDKVFGYQERYAEYRYKPSVITGHFRSTSSTPLDMWHLAQKFDSLPVLNGEFIAENAPIDRVVATPEEPQFIADVWHDLTTVRPMPVYSVPGLIDHF